MILRLLLSLSAVAWMSIGATHTAFAEGTALKANALKKVANVEVKLVSRKRPTFSITNNTQKPIRLSSGHLVEFRPMSSYVEYMENGKWETIGHSHDMLGSAFLLPPGKTVKFWTPVFDRLKKGMLVRVRVDSYYSKPFVW